MNRWEFEPTPVRSISPEDSARVWAAKGLLLGEDRPDDDRCTGCDAASCEPCRAGGVVSAAEGRRQTGPCPHLGDGPCEDCPCDCRACSGRTETLPCTCSQCMTRLERASYEMRALTRRLTGDASEATS